MRHRLGWLLGLVGSAALVGCSPSNPELVDDGRLDVMCSFFPMYIFAKNVVGDAPGVQVELMLPAQMGCPHDYDLTPEDMRRIATADVYIMNGAGLESFGADAVKEANPNVLLVDTSRGIEGISHDHGDGEHKHDHDDAEHSHDHDADADHKHDHDHDHADHKHDHDHEHADHKHEHDHADEDADHKHDHDHDHAHGDHEHGHHGHSHAGNVNPHFFSSPKQAAVQVRNIAEALASADPKNAETFRKNGEVYAAKLLALAEEFENSAKEFRHKEIVTMHEVFDYLARDCGLNVAATIFPVAGVEPSPNDVAKSIQTIQASRAPAVFTEPQYPSGIAKTIASDAGVVVEELDPAASGPADAGLDYYEVTMRKNLDTLKRVLGAKQSE